MIWKNSMVFTTIFQCKINKLLYKLNEAYYYHLIVSKFYTTSCVDKLEILGEQRYILSIYIYTYDVKSWMSFIDAWKNYIENYIYGICFPHFSSGFEFTACAILIPLRLALHLNSVEYLMTHQCAMFSCMKSTITPI